MITSKNGCRFPVLYALAVLAGAGAILDGFSRLLRADANPLCAAPEVYDLDGSGMVAPADLLALIDGMNGPDPQSPQFDIDGSGEVNGLDIDALAVRIEACSSQGASPPPDDGGSMLPEAGEPQIVALLMPSTPGPYAIGQQISIIVSLQRAQATGRIRTRLIQFDLALTNPDLGISYPITHPTPEWGPIAFWDFSSTPLCLSDPTLCGDVHFIDDSDPLLNTTYLGFTSSGSRQITVPSDSTPVPVGIMEVGLPLVPGIYRLDLMNAANSDVDLGAEFRSGFGTVADPYYQFRASTGQFAGGVLDLNVGDAECTPGFPCESDGNDCTDDVCVDGQCAHPSSQAGTPCGLDAGPCALDGVCDGEDACLPNYVPAGTVCRPASDECDATEACDGQSPLCPSDVNVANGTPCSTDGIQCTSDTCIEGICQHDLFPMGTPCGNQFPLGPCDLTDTCNGTGQCVLNLLPSTAVCREAANECDHAEFCTGTSVHCGPDLFAQGGSPCGNNSPQGVCDAADSCNGAGDCSQNLAPGGTPCRVATGECDESEFCNGLSPGCSRFVRIKWRSVRRRR